MYKMITMIAPEEAGLVFHEAMQKKGSQRAGQALINELSLMLVLEEDPNGYIPDIWEETDTWTVGNWYWTHCVATY